MIHSQITDFTMHGETGVQVKKKDFLHWLETHRSSELGSKIVAYSWYVDGQKLQSVINIHCETWEELPDASGFICFESQRNTDNCRLLDVYGKERMRLIVPYALTGKDISAAAEMWFRSIDGPYVNPQTGETGTFGVSSWIEYAGDYFFELDYRTGEFLWGRPIRF